MATLTLTVTYLGKDASDNFRYNFVVHVNWEGETPQNEIDLYYSIEGGEWGYLFLFQVGTGQTGNGTQEYAFGSHLPGAHIAFWAGLPGIIASNQVSIIVGEDVEPPQPPAFEWLWLIPIALVGIGIVYVIVKKKRK